MGKFGQGSSGPGSICPVDRVRGLESGKPTTQGSMTFRDIDVILNFGLGNPARYRSGQVTLINETGEAQTRVTSFRVLSVTVLSCPGRRSVCLILVSGARIVVIRP